MLSGVSVRSRKMVIAPLHTQIRERHLFPLMTVENTIECICPFFGLFIVFLVQLAGVMHVFASCISPALSIAEPLFHPFAVALCQEWPSCIQQTRQALALLSRSLSIFEPCFLFPSFVT